LKKLVLTLLILLVFAMALAACSPVPAAPTAAPTSAAVTATPAPPATETVPTTVEAAAPTADARPIVPAPVEGERPLASVEPKDRNERFSGPAEKYVEDKTIYIATIVTDKGNIVAELYQDTPEGLNNFVTLALNGFYDGLPFHRVEPGFVIQGGDPAGDGSGGPGYTIPGEINHLHPRGALAWARTGDQVNPERRSSGSQFYITLDETQFLDGAYSVFGYVIEGMDVVDKIAVGNKIQRIDITKGTASQIPTPAPTNTPTVTPTPTNTPTPYAPTEQEGRPLATVTVAEREGYYNTVPAMTIDVNKKYQATIATDKGDFVIDLDPTLAPITTNNFVMLANLGFYDGMPVAHVEPGTFMVLGSPAGNPLSDVGYSLPLEAGEQPAEVITGTVSMYPMPNEAGEYVANGSQFLIAFTAIPDGTTPLNVFGNVVKGMDIAQKLAIGDIVKSITIAEK
jgi:peptidyl-prolyl cis-trans isomerase B (cyclophilin B)